MNDKHGHADTHERVEDGHNGHLNGSTPKKRGGVINTLYPPGPKPGAGGRVKNHCRKFWWCDLLVLAIVTLIIVLPIIYVAIPKIAQHDLNASKLTVESQEVTSPTPDGIHLKLVGVTKSSSSFHPTIDGFKAALSLEGQTEPFLVVDVPQSKAEAETRIVIDEDLKFANKDRFIEYSKVFMGTEDFKVLLKGKTKLHQSGLQAISVDYNQEVVLKGLNKLQGLTIDDIKILLAANETLPDGSNMIGMAHIPNPSVMLLELGNVTMNLAVDGQAIGTSLIPNLTLRPGNNSVPLQSKVEPLTVLNLVSTKYTNGVIPLEISGNSSVVNGQHIEYYEQAIQANKIKLNLDLSPALKALGINTTSTS